MESLLKEKRYIALFVLPGFMVYAVFLLLPLIQTLIYSFNQWDGIGAMVPVQARNYWQLLTDDPVFLRGVRNSFIILIASVIGQILPALVLAILLSHFTKGLRFYKTVFFIPVILSTAAIALMWNKMYEPNYGMINSVFELIGRQDLEQTWLSDPDAVIWAVTAPIVWQYIGYHMVILYAGIKTIPHQYYEAALIDGASGIKATWYMTLPLLVHILKVCVVLSAVGSLKIFDHVYIMTKGGPFNSSTTVAIHMYQEAFSRMRFGYGSAIAIFLVIECLLISWLINHLIKGENIEY